MLLCLAVALEYRQAVGRHERGRFDCIQMERVPIATRVDTDCANASDPSPKQAVVAEETNRSRRHKQQTDDVLAVTMGLFDRNGIFAAAELCWTVFVHGCCWVTKTDAKGTKATKGITLS